MHERGSPFAKKKSSWIPIFRNGTYDEDEARTRAKEGTRESTETRILFHTNLILELSQILKNVALFQIRE